MPTQKEMALDVLEAAVRWGLIIGTGLQLWVWLSAALDVIVR